MSNYGRKNISEETIVKALKMVENGYSYSLIAEVVGCNKSLIGKWVKKSGIKPDTKIKKKSKPYDRSKTHISQDWSKVTIYRRNGTVVMVVGEVKNKYADGQIYLLITVFDQRMYLDSKHV